MIPVTESDPRISHAQILKFPKSETSVFNNLITTYSKSNSNNNNSSSKLYLSYADKVFQHHIPKPTVASWTSLISAFRNTHLALTHFVSMLRHPCFPSQRTFAVLFRTCAEIGVLSFGLQLHAVSVKLSVGSLKYCGSSLVNFYSKSGFFDDARKVFDEMPDKDEVCFGSVIVGLARNSRPVDALLTFGDMVRWNVRSSVYSVSGAVSVAGRMVGLEQLRILHCHSIVTGLEQDLVVGTSLIDAYGKCGMVSDAREVFDELLGCMNLVGWNAMMAGYAQQGDYRLVLSLLGLMKVRELVPDEYSFLAVMTSLANAGLVNETEDWLSKMETGYGVEPQIEHYKCLVAALGKAGRLKDAEKVATTIMPFQPDADLWRILLTASASHRAFKMARYFINKLISLNPQDDSAFVIQANVLFCQGRLNEAPDLDEMMKDDAMVSKVKGKSWVQCRGKAHVFLAGDQTHQKSSQIHSKLAELTTKIKELGYHPAPDTASYETEKREKIEKLVEYHSLKLALAFALVSGAAAAPDKPIHIVKNLRICKDCHESFRFFSRVLDKKIMVRDVDRYHIFEYGRCSCSD